MLKSFRPIFVGLLLVASLGAIYLGNIEQDLSLDAVEEIWADVLRDVDQFGLKLTRVSEQQEMEIGQQFAEEILSWYSTDEGWTSYVNAIGQVLTRQNARPAIKYQFHVLQSDCVNAFALPGGQVFVFTGMLGFVSSEAELAAILGHEIAHVDLRHCIEMVQYEMMLKNLDLSTAGQLVTVLHDVWAMGYRQYQEFDADARSLPLMVKAGYNPRAAVMVFTRLAKEEYKRYASRKNSKTPVGEMARIFENTLHSYAATHPLTTARVDRLKEIIQKAERSGLVGKWSYGKQNYKKRVPIFVKQLDQAKVKPKKIK